MFLFLYFSYHGELDTWSDKPRYTIDYAPPEMLEDAEFGTYSEAVDIWCLGATLYTMYVGHSPFRRGREDREISVETLRQRILNEDFYTESTRWQQATPELQNLLRGCLEKDVSKRLTLLQILDHNWFQVVLEENAAFSEDVESFSKQIKYETNGEECEEDVEEKVRAMSFSEIEGGLTHVISKLESEVAEDDATTLKIEETYAGEELQGIDGEDKNEVMNVLTNHDYDTNCVEDTNENDMEESLLDSSRTEKHFQEVLGHRNELSTINEVDEEDLDDATSGLGQSNSTDEEGIRVDEVVTLDAQLNHNEIMKSEEAVGTTAVEKDHHEDDNSSDSDDFEGFDEKMSPITKQISSLTRLIASLRRCKRQYLDEIQQPTRTTPPPKAPPPVHRTRKSVRNVQPLEDKIENSNIKTNTNKTPVNDTLTKLDSKSITISQTVRKSQAQTNSIIKNKSERVAILAIKTIIEEGEEDGFMGYPENERKGEAVKFKANVKICNQILHYTHISLKHFNIERRGVSNKNSRASLGQQLNLSQSLTTSFVATTASSSNENIFQAGRRQPERITRRCQRARYVFE